jgi:hypothetical protein
VLAGSQVLPLEEVAGHLLRQMASFPPDTIILLRRGRTTGPGPFEKLVAMLAETLKIAIEWREPRADEGGRSQTYLRDIELVGSADAVIAYFSEAQIMLGGTGHVVEKAIDQNVPVYAYAPIDGAVERVGEVEREPA